MEARWRLVRYEIMVFAATGERKVTGDLGQHRERSAVGQRGRAGLRADTGEKLLPIASVTLISF